MSILKDLEMLRDPSKKFLEWVRSILIRSPARLELVLECIINAGEATTPMEALEHLNDMMRKFSFDGLHITSTDLGLRREKKDPFADLEQRARERESTAAGRDPSRIYGIIGHLLMPKLLSGNMCVPWKEDTQLDLFLRSRATRDPYDASLPRALERTWEVLALKMRTSAGCAWFYEERREIERFYDLAESFFGEYATRVFKKSFMRDEYLAFLTLMSWSAALAYYRRIGRQLLVSEIPAIMSVHGVDGGRVDAVTIETESHQLARILTSTDFHSVGEIISVMHREIVRPRTIIIKDWKFAVGDGKSKLNRYLIENDEISSAPLRDHVRQMERYLALAYCDFLLFEHRRSKERPHLEINLRGELVYFLPDRLPVVHAMTPNRDRINTLVGELWSRWQNARKEARLREVTRLVVAYTTRLLEKSGACTQRASANLVNQGLLFPGNILGHPIEEIVHSYLIENGN